MQVCKTGCHIWILCVACDDGTLQQRQQNQPGKSTRCIIYKHETRWGISSLLHWGGRRFFPGVSFRTGHPLPISMDFKGFPMFGQKPEGSQLPQTSQTLEFRNLRRWRVIYIYIHLFPFNLQPPKTNGWTLKIAFGKFQPLVFRGVECIHQCSLDSLKI